MGRILCFLGHHKAGIFAAYRIGGIHSTVWQLRCERCCTYSLGRKRKP